MDSEIANLLLVKYGWLVFLVVVIARETVPVLVKTFSRRAQEDAEHRRSLEARSVAALEKISDAETIQKAVMESLKTLIETMNQRLANLERQSAAIMAGLEVLVDRNERVDQPTKKARARRAAMLADLEDQGDQGGSG